MLDEYTRAEQRFRARAAGALALAALMGAAPFGVADLVVAGHPTSGVGTLGFVVALCVHAALALRSPRWARYSGAALVPLCTAAIALSLRTHGLGALFWCYPAVLGYACLLPERTAWAACALTSAVAIGVAWPTLSPDIVLRAAVTLAVVAGFAATVVRVITTQSRDLHARGATDLLTGLPNRRSLDAGLNAAAAGAASGVPMALLALDIDHFKRVNDEHGHQAGDAVLRATGDFLRRRTRVGDATWRTGGEEFLVLLHGATHEHAREIGEKLVRDYSVEVERPDGMPATFSVGLAALAPDESVDDWFRRADRALYRAKALGRDRLSVAPDPPQDAGR